VLTRSFFKSPLGTNSNGSGITLENRISKEEKEKEKKINPNQKKLVLHFFLVYVEKTIFIG
jgi:uncharacterized protein YeeX (DUF496 family)